MKTLIISQVITFVLVLLGVGMQAQASAPVAKKPKVEIKILAVEKSIRKLILIDKNNKIYKMYDVSLGAQPLGHKMREGDGKTPEGRYVISVKNPNSKFYKSLGISYPNKADKQRARELGVSPGGDIMIHGLSPDFAWVGSAQTLIDWTQGCIAVTNEEMDEIFSLVKEGTPIYIWP